MKRGILLLIISAGLLSGCEKEKLPDPAATNPVFTVEGSIDGQARTISAGRDDYYLHTYFTSDSNNRYNLTGQFGKPECRDCPQSLKIELPAFQDARGELNLDEALQTGERSYYNPVRGKTVTFKPVSEGPGSRTYRWNFGDGRSSVKRAPEHHYPLGGEGEYTTTLRINHNNGQCVATTTRNVVLDQAECRVNYQVQPVNQTEVIFESDVGNIDRPLSYRWFRGDTLMSKVADPTYDFREPGTYEVCLIVEAASGCSASRCQQVDVFANGCNANFNYEISGDTARVDPAFLNISWRAEDGTLYQTGKNQQPEESYFRIVEAEPYQKNRDGLPTYRLKVEFDCMVYSGNDRKHLKDFKGTMAVAYPAGSE